MKSSHESMRINEHDGAIFIDHAGATMQPLKVSKQEPDDVIEFVLNTKDDIVEI
ncbi:MAG: hypothetical protein RPT25_06215 [Cycloclasticus sp.]